MFRNRFRQETTPQPAANAFVMCPVACLPGQIPAVFCQYQLALYQWALAEAEAVVRPSLPELDLLASWN